MSWGKWGQWGEPELLERPAAAPGALSATVYCPRCEGHTAWDNSADGTLTLACTGCGLTATSPLTEDEHDRMVAYDAKPVRLRRRRWVHV